MLTYDGSVLSAEAKRQLDAARFALISMTAVGTLVGIAVGLGAFSRDGALMVLFVAAIGAQIGFVAGSVRARALRLSAHLLLWQVQVEENTRNAAYYQHQLLQRVGPRKA